MWNRIYSCHITHHEKVACNTLQAAVGYMESNMPSAELSISHHLAAILVFEISVHDSFPNSSHLFKRMKDIESDVCVHVCLSMNKCVCIVWSDGTFHAIHCGPVVHFNTMT